jgi:cell wall-associated NlpC family hydrolase
MPEGGGSPVTRPLPLKVSERSIKHLVSSIEGRLGTRYRPGGTTPDGFDCSGFVQYLYKDAFRMLLPRTSGELAVLGAMVKKKQLRPGDLVFFSIDGNRIDHVGIFIGGKSFAHASTGGVKVNNIDEHYFFSRYACSARLVTTD